MCVCDFSAESATRVLCFSWDRTRNYDEAIDDDGVEVDTTSRRKTISSLLESQYISEKSLESASSLRFGCV